MIVRTPDSKWAIYSPDLHTLTRMGLDERAALSTLSMELGSIDKAREALTGGEAAWAHALADMDAPTRMATLRRFGLSAAPPVSPVSALMTKGEAAKIRRHVHKAKAEQKVKEGRARRAAQKLAARVHAKPVATPPKEPRIKLTPEERAARARERSLRYYYKHQAPSQEQRQKTAHERRRRVAMYLLFGNYSLAAQLCGCTPDGIKSSIKAAGVAPIAKRQPPKVEVLRTMDNFGFEEKKIERALKRIRG